MSYFLNLKNSSQVRFKNRKIVSKKFWIFLVGCFFILGAVFLFYNTIFAAKLTHHSTTISDSRPSINNVTYNYEWNGSSPDTLRCVVIESCTTSTGSCTTPPGMLTTSAAKETFTGLTAIDWTLDAGTNGTLKLTNAAGEAPGVNVSLVFSGIKNPSAIGSFATRIYTYSNSSCTNEVDFARSRFDIVSGVSISATVAEKPTTAEITFKGKGAPGALVTILRNNLVVGTAQISSNGYFSKKIIAVPPGISVFEIYAKDTKGRRTNTMHYTFNLAAGTSTVVSGIFLSPTMSLTRNQVYKGETINISGATFPFSTVNIFLFPGNDLFKTKARSNGNWSYILNTRFLGGGIYEVVSRAFSLAGEHSDFSKELSFEVFLAPEKECNGADLNLDNKVDIVDFSILLYFWGKKNPINSCANINGSGIVDLVDFSIMMYEWTE